jgi:hypothetical protein
MFNFRLNTFLLAVFLVGASAQAATISFSVDCNGYPGDVFDNSASCSNGGITATASVPHSPSSAGAWTSAFGPASAYASYKGTFGLEFTGGTGGGLFTPCLQMDATYESGDAYASFGSVTGSYSTSNLCHGEFKTAPFAFGVEQVVDLTLWAKIEHPQGPGMAYASFDGTFVVFDFNRRPLSGVTVYFQEIPEPSALVAASCGLALLFGLLYRARRRGVAPTPDHR